MFKQDLQTPCILLDMEILEKNIKLYQEACNKYGKELWPMIKTHKSSEIAKMQCDAGAKGFLCGTLDECEWLCREGIINIMYAYPVASNSNIERVIKLTRKCNFIIRLDNYDGAKMLNDAAEKANVKINYSIKIDSGLHRFGISPEKVVVFANSLKNFKKLSLVGISSHPGHAYSSLNSEQLDKFANEEKTAMSIALNALEASNYKIGMVTSGSTPTHIRTVNDENISI